VAVCIYSNWGTLSAGTWVRSYAAEEHYFNSIRTRTLVLLCLGFIQLLGNRKVFAEKSSGVIFLAVVDGRVHFPSSYWLERRRQ